MFLFYEHDLKSYEIVAAAVLLLMTIGLSAILLLGIWRPDWLHRWFDWVQRTAEGIFKRIDASRR